MTVVGICLGVAAIVSIDIVNKSVSRSFEDSINRVTGRASLQVTGAASGFPEDLLERVQAVPGVEYAVPVIDTQGILVGAKERSLMILGVDVLQDGNIREYKLSDENSDIPDPLLFLARPDSILLTRQLAEREGIRIDQEIQGPDGARHQDLPRARTPEPRGPGKDHGRQYRDHGLSRRPDGLRQGGTDRPDRRQPAAGRERRHACASASGRRCPRATTW